MNADCFLLARARTEKEAARSASAQRSSSKPASGTTTPARGAGAKGSAGASAATSSGAALGLRKAAAAGASTETSDASGVGGLRANVERLNLTAGTSERGGSEGSSSVPGTPKLSATVLAHDKVREEWRKLEETSSSRKGISLVVVGHVDAGKSTLMGRLLHELGTLSDKEHTSNERASAKIGKGSFAYAWALDSSEEERERGVTIDVAQDAFRTPHRRFTLLDAPGHRDFIPNMISGAAQADAALLVVDASKGAFEAGFGPNGQTREHAILVRSLGVQQLVVVVNKLDAVDYEQERFDEITAAIKPFLAQSGFDPSKLSFVPCGAAVGENLSERTQGGLLSAWYSGPRLVDVLDELEPPKRQIDTPLRMPVTNVFRGQTAISSGVGASGRVVGGVITVGDKVRIVPGDETATVRAIEQDGETVPWAVAGSAITAYLAGIDMVFINIGSVLCAPTSPVAMISTIVARILVFEPSHPLIAGTSLELFHHSSNLSATLIELVATLDAKTGAEIKRKPRVLGKGVTATVRIALTAPVAMEPFAQNRDMGRVVLRMRGESVAAGIVLECS